MNFDYKKFEIDLKDKTRSTFIACTGKLDVKEIAGFALYSDNSAMTISVTCNTYQHLKELQIEEVEEDGDEIYFKWTPGEWKYELVNAKEFQDLCALLRDTHFDEKSGIFSTHRNMIYSTAVKVLKELRTEGLFEKMNNDFVLMFGVSDFSDHKLEISFVKSLNSKLLAEEFEKWIVTQE
jgi:hypothetical protein